MAVFITVGITTTWKIFLITKPLLHYYYTLKINMLSSN